MSGRQAMMFRWRRRSNGALVFWCLISTFFPPLPADGFDNLDGFETQLEEAIDLLRAGRFEAAGEAFKVAIRKNPQDLQAYIYLGIAENESGHFANAVPPLREALRLDKSSEAAHYNLALSFLGLHKTEEAVREFQAVVKLDPKNESANHNLGVLLTKEDSYAAAQEYLEGARAAQPDDPAVLIHLADLYLRTRNDAAALQLIRDGMKRDPSGGLAGQLGGLLVQRGHYKEAVPVLEEARSLLPDTPGITGTLAQAYLGANQNAKVIELLAPIKDGEASWEVYYLRGLAFTSTGRRDEAVRALSKAVAMRPAEASPHDALGKLLLDSQDAEERKAGVYEVSEAIKLSPQEGNYYLRLASYYFDTGDPRGTIELLKSAIGRVPPSVQLYVTLGLAELELEGPVPATPFIEKAIALDPRAGAGYDLLGRCRIRVDDYANAARYFRKAAALTPENDIYFRDTAIALDKLGRTAEGLPFAEQSVKLRPDQLYDHYILGKLYSQIGRGTDAIRELERCVDLDPSSPLAYNLLATLYKHAGEDAKAASCWRTLRTLKEQSVEKTEEAFSTAGIVTH